MCYTIRKGCSCICASRLATVSSLSSIDSCLYDARDHLLGDYFKKDNGLIVFFDYFDVM